jgi:hypothetical protein
MCRQPPVNSFLQRSLRGECGLLEGVNDPPLPADLRKEIEEQTSALWTGPAFRNDP